MLETVIDAREQAQELENISFYLADDEPSAQAFEIDEEFELPELEDCPI